MANSQELISQGGNASLLLSLLLDGMNFNGRCVSVLATTPQPVQKNKPKSWHL